MIERPMREIVAIVLVLLVLPTAAVGCSFGPSPNFTEVTRSFTVAVRFEGKPLPYANVTLHSWGDMRSLYTVTDAPDGTALLEDIPPGKYFVDVDYIGIAAAWEQIEVRDHASFGAKPRLEYRWGEADTTVRQFAGSMTSEESRPNSLRRIVNHVLQATVGWLLQGPIVGAKIRLIHPTNGSIYNVTSDRRGEFALPVPYGTYVMEVLRGEDLNIFSNFVVRVSPSATKDLLELKTDGNHLCGGPSLRFVP